MTMGLERRLAAIVAADVAGYSRLMAADEGGTLSALKTCRAENIDPLINRHGGRLVKSMGDGLLLEFPSVVAAVEFAIAMQTGIKTCNREIPEDKAIRFRIGVHVGDVIIEDDDIFGDGVNMAARIEPLAEIDGVCISDDAHRQVRDRVKAVWRNGGEQDVKNMARPIRVWHWQPDAVETPKTVSPPVRLNEAPDLPEKPSIAVLPFDNMSGNPEQDYFADGMTEDLITDLSKISGLFVVARNSSMVFKGKAVDIREAARHLGVRYILEGSVRKAGSRVRINVQLIDAISGGHLWAERYDGSVEDVFELQDDVGAKVVSALSVRLSGDEDDRLAQVHTRNLDAYELYVRAKATPFPPIPERIQAAHDMFRQVIEMDPDFAGGYAGVSWMLSFMGIFGHMDLDEMAAKASPLARKAVELDANFGWSHVASCLALLMQKEHDKAIAAVDRAVECQPNDADAHAYRGLTLGFAGQPERGVEPIDHALRLNPQFVNGPYLNLRGVVMALAGDYEGAVTSFEQNVARHGPVGPPVLAWITGAYGALGRHEDAQRTIELLKTRFPAFRLTGWNFIKLVRSPEDRERFHDLMAGAGVPE